MSTSTKSDIRKTDFLKLGTTAGDITKVISPNNFQVGLDDPDFNSDLNVKGSITAVNGITGSITQVSTGINFLQAGTNISVTKNDNGSLTIGSTGFPSSANLTLGNGLYPNGTTYNGSQAVSVSVLARSVGGLQVLSSGARIDPGNLNQKGTPVGADRVIIGDSQSSNGPMYATITQLLSLGNPVTVSNAITFGDAIKDSNNAASSWNNSAAATIAVDTLTNGALSTSAGKLYVNPNNATATTTIDITNDYAIIYDADAGATRKVALQYIAGTAPNGLTIGNGLGPNGTVYNGSVARTINIVTDATLQSNSTGLAVLKVPNALTGAKGIETLSFNGSAALGIQIDLNSTGGLNFNNSSNDLQLDVNSLTAGPAPQPSHEIAVAFNTNDTRKIDLGAVKTMVLTGRESGTVWVDGGNKAHTTSSISIDSGASYADGKGTDIFFYVSGTLNNNSESAKKSVFGGDVYVSGTLLAPTGISGSITRLADGNPYLIAGTNISLSTSSAGAITIASTGGGGSVTFVSGSTSVSSVTNIDTTRLGTIQNLSGGSISLTGSIGIAEDGSYTDGLFTDFVSTTPIGTAVDRFNEVLKGLAPAAAPTLDDVDCNDSGAVAKLSFGNTQSISGYTNNQPSTLSPASSLSNIDINGTYTNVTTGNDVRVACFSGTTVIDGTLNADIPADSPNYAADAFGNGDQGTLKLFVNNNSSAKHSTNLSSFGSGTSVNGNGSGFILSAVTNGSFADSSAFSTFKHRTGTYTIATTDQRTGWNYARIVHTIGGTDTTTNYIEWVNDPNSNALASAGSVLDTLSMTGNRTLSGVKYHTAGTAQYRVRVTNAYKNVYSTSNITFTGIRCSVSSQAFPAINHASGEDENKVLHITGSASTNTDPMINIGMSVGINIPAPLKSNLNNSGAQTIGGILLYNLSNTSTITSETFRSENYRLISGSYTAQSAVADAANSWNSGKHMSGSNTGHQDGLLFYNSSLYAPRQGQMSGDFRNSADGGSITNGPAGNVNYSGITTGLRTFYRYVQNNSGGSKSNFSLTLNGSGTIASQPTALNTTNIHVLLKIPTTNSAFQTGWMDLALPFQTGQNQNGSGCLDGSFDSSLNASNNGTFGTQSVGSNEYVMIKIEADASWTGNVSQMSITWT